MMKRKRRTRMTVEQREVVIIRNLRKRQQGFCAECAEPIALITVEKAIRISGLSSRAIHRLIEAGQIHFAETAEGLALICPATLVAWVLQAQGKPS